MSFQQILVRGSKDKIEKLKSKLEKDFAHESVSFDIQPSRENLFSRTPNKQIEVVDLIIGITINLISSALYDKLKSFINNNKEKMSLEVPSIPNNKKTRSIVKAKKKISPVKINKRSSKKKNS